MYRLFQDYCLENSRITTALLRCPFVAPSVRRARIAAVYHENIELIASRLALLYNVRYIT